MCDKNHKAYVITIIYSQQKLVQNIKHQEENIMLDNQAQSTQASTEESKVLDATKLWADDYSEFFQPDKTKLIKRYSVPHFNGNGAAESEAAI